LHKPDEKGAEKSALFFSIYNHKLNKKRKSKPGNEPGRC